MTSEDTQAADTQVAETQMTPEMQALKTRLKAIWMAGDYAEFAKPMEPGALEFLRALHLTPGSSLLDVGCGAGQIAIPAARAGVRVTGLDLAPNQIAQARARAEQEGLTAHFDEGDAENMPYPDAQFDTVVSLFGAMFAPRPERVAAELLRVTRPGGRIVMANWTPEGFVGQLFRLMGKHVPPPPLMPSPLLWGKDEQVQDRLTEGTAELHLTRRMYPFSYPFAPGDVVKFYRDLYGPTNRAFAALDEHGQQALQGDLEQLWTGWNTATDGSTRYDSEYLEVVAIRA